MRKPCFLRDLLKLKSTRLLCKSKTLLYAANYCLEILKMQLNYPVHMDDDAIIVMHMRTVRLPVDVIT